MIDLLIFDMDGVLIDVSQSYRRTIQQTIRIYLKDCLGLKADLVSFEAIALFKSAGGFNNDWDLTAGCLCYLLSIANLPYPPKKKKHPSPEAAVLYLRQSLAHFHQEKPIRLDEKDLLSFLEEVKTSGGGLKGIQAILGRKVGGWIYQEGELHQQNLVKRIFQEIYLGKQFSSHYRLQPLFYRDRGLYLREKLLIRRTILSSLHKKMKLAIASGRPRWEAQLALKRFRLTSYFDSLVTLDECEEEEKRIFKATGKRVKRTKPHPYPLLRVIQEIGLSHPRVGYVGDVVDDILTAKAIRKGQKVFAIAFLGSYTHRKEARERLSQAGANLVIETPEDLLHLAKEEKAIASRY